MRIQYVYKCIESMCVDIELITEIKFFYCENRVDLFLKSY